MRFYNTILNFEVCIFRKLYWETEKKLKVEDVKFLTTMCMYVDFKLTGAHCTVNMFQFFLRI